MQKSKVKNQKSHFIISSLLVLIITFTCYSQDGTKVLAKVGLENITVEEFKNRFEFMPHLNYSNNNLDTVKKEFLRSLIAEKLWAYEAYELGLDTMESVRLSLKTLQNLFIKDEVYKQEVESKIIITNEEISKGLSRVNRILNVELISSKDSSLMKKFYELSVHNTNTDSLIVTLGLNKTPYQIKYAQLLDDDIEDIVFSLKIKEISVPIDIKGEWFVIKLLNDERDISIIEGSEHAKNIVIKKLKDQKAQIIGRKFLDDLLGGKSISVDRKLFDLVADNFFQVLKKRFLGNDSEKDIQLTEVDILNVNKMINQNDLEKNFIHLQNNNNTIKDFLYYLIYQKISFSSLNLKDIKQTLNKAVKQYIEDLVISNEGRKRGLENNPSVKNDLQIWKDYYLSETLMNRYSDSITVSDYDIESYLKSESDSSTDIVQVNIIEILTDDLSDIEELFEELKDGKRFEELVSRYNKREITKPSNGEWGFFNAIQGGEIGKIAEQMEIGQTYGPLKVPEGYSVFKLIDKRKSNLNLSKSNKEEDIKFIRLKLALKKMDDLLNSKTVSYANKYRISIDDDLLTIVQTSELNTFTYRLIGFGGRIAAFPVTVPMFEWYNSFINQKEIP